MSVNVRFAAADELPAVNRLRAMVNQLHVEGRPDIFRPGFGQAMQDLLAQQFADPRYDVIVAVLDGCVCGYATVCCVDKPDSPYNLARRFYHVEEFGVDSAYRRRGIATALVDFMKQDARRRHCPRIELDMWEFNQSALAFYEAAGFATYRRYMELNVDE